MRVSVVAEIKNHEDRVALTPAGVHELTTKGHEVYVEKGAGSHSGFSDAAYEAEGAKLVSVETAWKKAELMLKVKEPLEQEYQYLRENLTVFTYLHLAADKELTEVLLETKCTGIAYETVQLANRSLPLLQPMSEVAGRLAIQVGGYHLMANNGGVGLLLGGVPGTPKAKVVVIGGGVAGEHAATMAIGMQADVTVVDVSLPRLRELDAKFHGTVKTRPSTAYDIRELLKDADLVIGSVLIPGAKAPKLVTDEMVKHMKRGSVLVDIAIDQGGCFENSHATTHDNPTFKVHNSTYYCVANMPGAVPATSTRALTNATLPYVIALANKGVEQALREDEALAKGLNTYQGKVTNQGVAEAFELELAQLSELLR